MKKSFKNAFPIVAASLGNKFGVQIKIEGNAATTDGERITLPALNIDENNALREVAWGYLAHEAAHIRFSDFRFATIASSRPIRLKILNILEDIRIEKEIQAIYPGTKASLEAVVDYLLVEQPIPVDLDVSKVHPGFVLSWFLQDHLRVNILRQRALEASAIQAEAALETTFSTGVVTRLFGLLSDFDTCQSTEACLKLTDSIITMLEEEQAKENAANAKAKAESDEQAEQQPSDDADNSAETESADNTPQPSALPEASPEDGDHLPDADESVGQHSMPLGQADNDPSQSGSLEAVLKACEQDLPEDIFQGIANLLSSQPTQYYDEMVSLASVSPHKKGEMGRQLVDSVLSESGKVRASLSGIVQSSQMNKPICKKSGTRIKGSRLARLAQGDTRVFQRSAPRVAANAAVHILLDGSVSMEGVIPLATKAVAALTLAFEGIAGVNPAITRFPYQDTDDVEVLLKHGQKLRPNADNLLPLAEGSSTPLDSALWFAASRVLATREKRKVIIVITDGEPNDARIGYLPTRSIIQRCLDSGIELVGIGVGMDVGHLFDKHIRINDISDLRKELFSISQALLAI
jgi:Mg-chelatase subunit ChlD